jgi:Rab family protein
MAIMQQEPAENYDFLYKIVLVGDAGVGKTHILSRYIKGTLPKTPQATIGVEFATRTVTLGRGTTAKAQIWDTAGQEKYRSITRAHYRRAVGALLVYDVSNDRSFLNLKSWIEDLRSHAEPGIVIMLVGNKTDLCDRNPNGRKVPIETAKAFAASNRLLFEETSAITMSRIKEAFEGMLEAICTARAGDQTIPTLRQKVTAFPEPQKKGCCWGS